MGSEIDRCFKEYSLQLDDVDMASIIFDDWGKAQIKLTNCSPDAFFQMAIQLSYFKVFKLYISPFKYDLF